MAFWWKASSEASLQPSWEKFRRVRASCDLPNSSQLIMEEQVLMSDSRFIRLDLVSWHTAASKVECSAVRGSLRTDDHERRRGAGR
jgi:hypothetical protein